MQEATILYKNQVDLFSKRLLKSFYPYVIIPFIFLFIPFFNHGGDKLIMAIWVTIMLLIVIMMIVSSYKWAYNQIASLTFYNDQFEIEVITKNARYVYRIEKNNFKAVLKWQGGRPKILKLSLFDNESKIADFYSAGKRKIEYALEEIVHKINSSNTSR